MIVQGDIAGIHGFVTNLSTSGGGQAKRLRARSFYVQLLCEVAAVQVSRTLEWPIDREHLVMSAAGHFVLRGDPPDEADQRLATLHQELNQWLLDHVDGDVKLALGWSSNEGTELDQFRESREHLNASQLRPLASVVCTDAGWNTTAMVLSPLDTPCVLCRQRPGKVTEKDIDGGEERLICSLCDRLKRFGTAVVDDRRVWLSVNLGGQATLPDHAIEALGVTVALDVESHMPNPHSVLACTHLTDPAGGQQGSPFATKWIRRTFARSVPKIQNEVADFSQLADKATGDNKLGVLMADGDGMGVFWDGLFDRMQDLGDYSRLSGEIDSYSATSINDLIESAPHSDDPLLEKYRWIYTVFAGGDDLLYVGPWDVILDFASTIRNMFTERFGQYGLSLSCGVAIVKHQWPIRRMATMAEELLEQAKQVVGRGQSTSRDQVAALGEIWKCDDHPAIIAAGRQWVEWVERKTIERGLLRDLYELSEARWGKRNVRGDRTNELMATARLCYLLERRYPKHKTVRVPGPGPRRNWAIDPCWQAMQDRLRTLIENFESPQTAEDRNLSASLTYALLATRSPSTD